ncbi:MAG: hypothetical protein FWF10_10360 [Clostridiales bacterium]|nr:hypothetical protein [Clostridiales bacterium]
MALKQDTIEFVSRLSMQEIGARLQTVCKKLRAQVSHLEVQEAMFGGTTERPGIAILVFRKSVLGSNPWGVEVYVYEQGAQRRVELVALGTSAGGLLAAGAYMWADKQAAYRDLDGAILIMGASKSARKKIEKALK